MSDDRDVRYLILEIPQRDANRVARLKVDILKVAPTASRFVAKESDRIEPQDVSVAVQHFNEALGEMRAKLNGTETAPLAAHDLHRWVSWLTEVEWRLNQWEAEHKP